MGKYNYMPVARQTLLYCGLCHCYVVGWTCVHAHRAKRGGERKIV